jgi:hypothetical protein
MHSDVPELPLWSHGYQKNGSLELVALEKRSVLEHNWVHFGKPHITQLGFQAKIPPL